ncbi:unnamed protein product [Leptosia nina]|uniref:Tubulin glycylase 3A n=1 Tax=Leptosia nina TaxID=320188 RepID=A0AAV1JK49_9NEOP
MAITMDLEESVSDSKLHKESIAKKELRPTSAVSLSKSDHGLVESTSSIEQLKQYKSWVSADRWNELKKIADTAMKDRKVFMIKGGGFPAVRRALTERGWIEKYESHKVRHPPSNIDPRKVSGKELTKVERMILYKFMEHHSVDFLWTTKRDKYDWLLSNKDVVISRFCRSIFTTKEGLTSSLTQMHWYTDPGVALTRFPRCYNIYNSDSLEEFIDDFRITACISVLKWLSNTLQEKGESLMVQPHGKVPFSAIEFAITRLSEYVAFFSHKDIDDTEEHAQHVWEHEWDQFLTHHYLLVHENSKFAEDKNINIRQLEKKGAKMLGTMVKYWPQMDIDGVFNIWIVKPGNKCRGKGIQLMNNIKDIIGLINIPAQKTRYVVQKYIGIKQCLIGAMLACQESMDKRQNSFELYGADFMLTEDFTPWLIEINSSPDLAPTTSVTARLCPQCLEDVIKVVLDRRSNPEADTGTFELVYRQIIPKAPAYLGLQLCINGKRLIKKSKEKKQEPKSIPSFTSPLPAGDAVPGTDQPVPAEYSGPIITDFLTWLNPYDALPTNKDGIVIGPKESLTVRQAVSVVNSSIVFKNASKKRKSSALSCRTHRGRREKNSESKRRVKPHSCCRPEVSQCDSQITKYRTESAKKSEKPKIDRSVGNKRCYIDPIEWERETASILRSTISIQNKMTSRIEVGSVRQSKSGTSTNGKPHLEPIGLRQENDSNPIKKLSAIGKSICKLQDEKQNRHKHMSVPKSCASTFAPYRVVLSPNNDE